MGAIKEIADQATKDLGFTTAVNTNAIFRGPIRTGLSHSKTAFPLPPAKHIAGFQHIGIGVEFARAAE